MANRILIKNGTVVDGSGTKPRAADVAIVGESIIAIGKNVSLPTDTVIDARGLIVAPGFIDTHSHADGGLLETPLAETQIRQGITTSIVGQDGGSHLPLSDWFRDVANKKVTLNIASFVGHGTVRGKVLGNDAKRKSTPDEIRQMQALVEREMNAGALGLSSGLEYEPAVYADTEELIALAKVAGAHGGLYISHVRDEEDDAMASFTELIRIAKEGRLPAQISHIKLAASPVWGKTSQVFRMMDDARKSGLDITADVYPYTYWQSSIIVLMPPKSDVRTDRKGWEDAVAHIGGPPNILVTGYKPDRSWEGQTISQIATLTKKDPISVILEIVDKTDGQGAGVVVTAMQEKDLRAFIAHPRIMFCTDGGLNGSHPRGAGSYPRILGKYVREERVLSLEQGIHKMSSLPATRMRFQNRGLLAPGYAADIVLFDPRTIHDTATTKSPRATPVGLPTVLVNGIPVLLNGQFTNERPGQVLRRS